jgi:hypothetical protein
MADLSGENELLKSSKKARSVLHMYIVTRMGKNFELGIGKVLLSFWNVLGA